MARSTKSSSTPATGWIPSLLGAALLVASGFSLGLVVGIVKEEPELVAGHLGGRSQEISWSTQLASEPEPTPIGTDYNAAGPANSASDTTRSALGSAFSADPARGGGMPELSLPSASAVPAPVAKSKRTRSEGVAVSDLPTVSAARPSRNAGGFSVQVGAFKASRPAEQVADELRSKGYASYVVPAVSGGKGLWRVRIGPVATRAEADRTSTRLKREEKMMPFVLSEGGG